MPMKTPTIGNWMKRTETDMTEVQMENLLSEVEKLHHRHELAGTVGPDYFEPGMMEYLEYSDGIYNESSGEIILSFESRGTRYEGRTEQIEKVKEGDEIRIVRDESNPYNYNNFRLLTRKGKDVGNMPAELCNALAPLHDAGKAEITEASASYVEPLSKRNRHAKQAVLFVRMKLKILR